MQEEVKKHGGPRPGSGRKKKSKLISFYLNSDLILRLEKIKNKSQFYNQAIREKLDKLDKN